MVGGPDIWGLRDGMMRTSITFGLTVPKGVEKARQSLSDPQKSIVRRPGKHRADGVTVLDKSNKWAARAPRPGALSSTISSGAASSGPSSIIVDGGAGHESAIAAVWDSVPVQRCTVHKQSESMCFK
jgi:hypothetical protein